MKTVRLALALVTAAVLVAVTGCTATADVDGQTAEPYRIGVVLSLNGSYAGLGVPERQAIELERDRVNAAGGINGRPVEVFFEDDGTDAAKAQAAAVRLIDEEGVIAIIGATGTGQTMAMRTDVERAQVPQVSMAGGSVITAELSSWVFQTPWPNRVVVPFVLQKMASKGLTKVAIISDTGGYGADGHDIIVASAPGAGVTIVADETFNPGDADMTAQLTKIRSAGPDAVLMWAAGKEAATIAKNMRQLNMQQPLYGGPGIARTEFIEGGGDAAEGVKLAAGKILLPESYGAGTGGHTVAIDFIERYTEAYGSAPDIFAGHAYDAFGLVIDALRRTEGDATPETLRDALEETSGWVGVGGTFSYSAEDHNGLSASDIVLYEIDGGTWRLDQ